MKTKYRITCPKCHKTTRTDDLLNLLEENVQQNASLISFLDRSPDHRQSQATNSSVNNYDSITDGSNSKPKIINQQLNCNNNSFLKGTPQSGTKQELKEEIIKRFHNIKDIYQKTSQGSVPLQVNSSNQPVSALLQAQIKQQQHLKNNKILKKINVQNSMDRQSPMPLSMLAMSSQGSVSNQKAAALSDLPQEAINHSTTKNGGCNNESVVESINLLQTIRNIQDEKQIICKEHNDFVSLYCGTCRCLLCVNCLYNSIKHKRHEVGPLKDSLDVIKRLNQQFSKEAKNNLNTIEEQIKICVANKYLLDIGYYNAQDCLQREFKEIISEIQNQELKIKEDLKALFQLKIKEQSTAMNDLVYLKSCLKEYREIESLESTNINLYMFSIYSMIQKTLSSIDLNFKQLKLEDMNVMNFQGKSQLGKQIQIFGEVCAANLNLRDDGAEDKFTKSKQLKLKNNNSQSPCRYSVKKLPNIKCSDNYIKRIVSSSSEYSKRQQSINFRSATPPVRTSEQRLNQALKNINFGSPQIFNDPKTYQQFLEEKQNQKKLQNVIPRPKSSDRYRERKSFN